MWYLIGEILVFLLITAVLWGAIGWWLRSLGHTSERRRRETEWTAKLQSLQRSRDSYRDQLEHLKHPGDGLADGTHTISDSQRAHITAHVKKLEAEVDSGRERLAKLDHLVEKTAAGAAERDAEFGSLRERLAASIKALRERDERLAQLTTATQPANDEVGPGGARREFEARVRRYEQTIARQRQRIEELAAHPAAEQEQIEHGKLLNVIQAQKRTIASLNERVRSGQARTPAGNSAPGALLDREDTIRELHRQLQPLRQHSELLAEKNRALLASVRQQEQTIADLNKRGTAAAGRSEDELMLIIREQEKTIADLNARLRQLNERPPRTAARHTSNGPGDLLPGDLFDEKPAVILGAPEGLPDDLKKIHGVGPVLESKLNSIGVYHFRQIAAFSDNDIHWLASQLHSFPNRIMRDRWVAQAAELESQRRGGAD